MEPIENDQIITRLEKRRNIAPKIILGIATFLLVGFGYLYISGLGTSVWEGGSAMVIKSWNDMFDLAPQDDLSYDISLESDMSVPDQSSSEAFGSYASSSGDTLPVNNIKKAPVKKLTPEKLPTVTPKKTSTVAQIPGKSLIAQSVDHSVGHTTTSKSLLRQASASSPPGNTAQKLPQKSCTFSNASGSVRSIIFNEIAWMGSVAQNGETASKASGREWMELKNISGKDINISGWEILDANNTLTVMLPDANIVASGGLYLISRGEDTVPGLKTDFIYSGGLSNTGSVLTIFYQNCDVSDTVDASTGWPHGDNTTKQTLERDADGVGWHTSVSPGGTPKTENSVPVLAATSSYLITVSMNGEGSGVVSSSIPGILCGFLCAAYYPAGTKIGFTVAPDRNSLFGAWSGACHGTAPCSFTVTSSAAVAANFTLKPHPLPVPPQVNPGGEPLESASSSASSSNTGFLDHLVIREIQISGALSSNDFVKIFNPTGATVDVGGWKLHKKSNTGTDYSLRTFPKESSVAGGGYFIWANSGGDFSSLMNADVSSTETLAAGNSVALLNADGDIIDAVAWGTGTNQYVEGSPYPTDPVANQILTRKSEDGFVIDTNDNAADFIVK